jgi:hypothetical protein
MTNGSIRQHSRGTRLPPSLIRQHTAAYVSIRQHTSAYLPPWPLPSGALPDPLRVDRSCVPRPGMPAYVSIRLHTSADASKRELWWPYVSMPENGKGVNAIVVDQAGGDPLCSLLPFLQRARRELYLNSDVLENS